MEKELSCCLLCTKCKEAGVGKNNITLTLFLKDPPPHCLQRLDYTLHGTNACICTAQHSWFQILQTRLEAMEILGVLLDHVDFPVSEVEIWSEPSI